MVETMRPVSRLDELIETFIKTVEKIMNGKDGFTINQEKQLLNVKPPVFKGILSDNCADIGADECIKAFKKLEYIKTERGANTSVQWTGNKFERVIAVNLKLYLVLKELHRPDFGSE